jgi:hypothetical protein
MDYIVTRNMKDYQAGGTKIILKMNYSGMSPENIASITGKDLDEINAILEGKSSGAIIRL